MPRIATDFTAIRLGNEVRLRWTTPTRTTDGVDAKAPITAEICRAPVAVANQSARRRPPVAAATCTVVKTVPVRPGVTEVTDLLSAALTTGEPRLLAYQVQLRGALGKTAGPSAPAYTAYGAGPGPVTDLRVQDTHTGALVQWTPLPDPASKVELSRELVSAAKAPSTSAKASTRSSNPFRPKTAEAETATPGEVRLSAGDTDAGGALDRTAELGATYAYSAERVLTLTLGARKVELRSAVAGPVQVTMRDVFPPAAPTGLVATPGPGSIDLSWDPGSESRVAGFRVYRAEASGASAAQDWRQVTPELVTTPAYRDLSAVAGQTYRYRVTAVGSTGNESSPSAVVAETAPPR